MVEIGVRGSSVRWSVFWRAGRRHVDEYVGTLDRTRIGYWKRTVVTSRERTAHRYCSWVQVRAAQQERDDPRRVRSRRHQSRRPRPRSEGGGFCRRYISLEQNIHTYGACGRKRYIYIYISSTQATAEASFEKCLNQTRRALFVRSTGAFSSAIGGPSRGPAPFRESARSLSLSLSLSRSGIFNRVRVRVRV